MKSTLGAQPEIVPCSVANRKNDGPLVVPFVTTKLAGTICVEPLNTIPVGAPPSAEPVVPGIATTSGTMWPAPSYSVDVALPLLATHTGPNGLNTIPQALIRFGSGPLGLSAGIEPSETR